MLTSLGHCILRAPRSDLWRTGKVEKTEKIVCQGTENPVLPHKESTFYDVLPMVSDHSPVGNNYIRLPMHSVAFLDFHGPS